MQTAYPGALLELTFMRSSDEVGRLHLPLMDGENTEGVLD